MSGRVKKSMLNAEVNILFYFLSLALAFFSRKIFLDCLGTEFIGLTGTLGNILGYLNLAELGITASIGYFAFYSFLGSSLIGYFINYRQILLSADQKNYLAAMYMQSANLIKIAVQIFLAYTYKNLYVWVGVEFLIGIIGCILLNWKINKEYPWLHVDKRQGKALLKKYPEVMAKTRQVFIHKIKDFVLVKSDELFIFLFVSLKMVAFHGNYMIIISKLISLFSASARPSFGASKSSLVCPVVYEKEFLML